MEGSEFDNYEGMLIVIVKVLHSLFYFSEIFYVQFTETLISFGFTQTQHDNELL